MIPLPTFTLPFSYPPMLADRLRCADRKHRLDFCASSVRYRSQITACGLPGEGKAHTLLPPFPCLSAQLGHSTRIAKDNLQNKTTVHPSHCELK